MAKSNAMRQVIQLAKFADLQKGWDGYGACAIDQRAIVAIGSLQFVPTCDGGVQVEWHVGGVDIEVEFAPDGTPIGVIFCMESP